MTQLGMGVAALNHDSVFAAAYEKGMKKSEYWTYALEDSLNLIARLPALAARIYRNIYNPGAPLLGVSKDLDLVGAPHRANVANLTDPAYSCSGACRQLRDDAWVRGQSRPNRVSAPVHLDPR